MSIHVFWAFADSKADYTFPGENLIRGNRRLHILWIFLRFLFPDGYTPFEQLPSAHKKNAGQLCLSCIFLVRIVSGEALVALFYSQLVVGISFWVNYISGCLGKVKPYILLFFASAGF